MCSRIKNQIDLILVINRRRNDILDVGTYRGADCDPDHMIDGVRVRKRTLNSLGIKIRRTWKKGM
jgi:hypothetical protein